MQVVWLQSRWAHPELSRFSKALAGNEQSGCRIWILSWVWVEMTTHSSQGKPPGLCQLVAEPGQSLQHPSCPPLPSPPQPAPPGALKCLLPAPSLLVHS